MLEQLLDSGEFGVEVLAAGDRVRSRRPCRGVHICDIPDPTQWLEGGELILTTGHGLAGSEELQRTFVERVAARDCVALGYSAHDGGATPPAMVEAAERVGLPLFAIPFQVPLIDITMFVTRSILDDHYSALRSALSLHRRVLAAVTQNSGIPAILGAAGREMPGRGMVLLDYYGAVLAQHDPEGYLAGSDPEELRARGERAMVSGDRYDRSEAGVITTAACVRICGEAEAFLVTAAPRAVDDHEELLLEQVIAGITMTLTRELSLRQTYRALVGELIEGVATNQISQQVLAERMRKVAIDGSREFRMLCVPLAAAQDPTEVCRLLEDTLAAARPAVGVFEDAVYAVVAAEHSDAADPAQAAMRRRGWRALVGRSRPHRGPDGLATAFRECFAAARRAPGGAGVYDVEDLDVVSLLGGPQGELGELVVSRVLGPLIEHDLTEGSRLVESLSVFLRHGCKPGPAAAQLFVHRHTLAYRLDRIATITGRDPRDGEHLLEFTLALELHRRAGSPTGLPVPGPAGTG
ncbi:MAG: PucR family transcriptional regulator [Cryptosporangiaceae bacterium]|jgi:purine catabolism regulator|nr:PucR family transcriptional regulator [Cryptosporangiaceae bacterium]